MNIGEGTANRYALLVVLTLRPLEMGDEEVAVRTWREFQSTPRGFLPRYMEGVDWADYLAMLADHREGRNLPEGLTKWVMYAAVVDGEFVGRTSIRFELNELQAYESGNVGYIVLEEHRNKGYATQILHDALLILADEGISTALLTCWDHNIGSRKVIENNGGQLEGLAIDKDDIWFRRYWVTV
jgi:predicted acetyltransferase